MKITIEGEPKEIADFAFGIQNRLSPEEFNSYICKCQNDLIKGIKDIIVKEISSANRDNA